MSAGLFERPTILAGQRGAEGAGWLLSHQGCPGRAGGAGALLIHHVHSEAVCTPGAAPGGDFSRGREPGDEASPPESLCSDPSSASTSCADQGQVLDP